MPTAVTKFTDCNNKDCSQTAMNINNDWHAVSKQRTKVPFLKSAITSAKNQSFQRLPVAVSIITEQITWIGNTTWLALTVTS